MKILRKAMVIIASAVMSLSLAACQVNTSVGTNGEPEEFRQYKTDAINYVEQTYPGMEYKLIKAGYAKVTNMLAPTEDPTKIEYTFENISSGETFVVTCDTYNNRIYDDYSDSYDDYSDSYDDYSDSYDDYSDSYDDYSDSYDDYSDSYDGYSDSYDDYSDSYDDYYNDYDSDYYSDEYSDSYDDYSDSYDDYYSDDYYTDDYYTDDYYSDQYYSGEQI